MNMNFEKILEILRKYLNEVLLVLFIISLLYYFYLVFKIDIFIKKKIKIVVQWIKTKLKKRGNS